MTLYLEPRGPWLVRGETEPQQLSPDSNRPQMVQLPLLDSAQQPLLPASSLKGVMRSTAERILRTCEIDSAADSAPLACIPFVRHAGPGGKLAGVLVDARRHDISCSELLEWYEADPERLKAAPQHASAVYWEQCLACQLFGSTAHAALLQLEDRRPTAYVQAVRSHVAIDRLTSGVGEGPFVESLVLPGRRLIVDLTITNFALWQVGLIALVLQELQRGYTAIGGGTRKGQGQMTTRVADIDIWYARRFYGVRTGVVSAQPEIEGDLPALLPELEPEDASGWRAEDRVSLRLNLQAVQQLFTACVAGPWLRRIGLAEPAGGAAHG